MLPTRKHQFHQMIMDGAQRCLSSRPAHCSPVLHAAPNLCQHRYNPWRHPSTAPGLQMLMELTDKAVDAPTYSLPDFMTFCFLKEHTAQKLCDGIVAWIEQAFMVSENFLNGKRIRAIQNFVGSAIDSLAPLVKTMDEDGKIWLQDDKGTRLVVIPEEFHSRASAMVWRHGRTQHCIGACDSLCVSRSWANCRCVRVDGR